MKKMEFLALFLLLLIALACKQKEQNVTGTTEKSPITGLASPINLGLKTTEIFLSDYFPDTNLIDSIVTNSNLQRKLSDNKSELTLTVVSEALPNLTTIDIWSKGIRYSIPVKKSSKVGATISFDPKGKDYKDVRIKGEFNGWNSNACMTRNGKIWEFQLEVEPGNYAYQIGIDGKWIIDPDFEKVGNGQGGFNSVFKIGNLDNNQKPFLFTHEFSDNTVIIGCTNECKELKVFWQNQLIPVSEIKFENGKFVINIPQVSINQKRSFIRAWAYNQNGISNDILIPLERGKVLNSVSQIERTDFEAATMYNVFIDRFFDGNPANNRPINSKEVHPKADYHGGDVAGIQKKIEEGFFDELGINTLWISPVVKNPEGAYGEYPNPKTKFSAYHGYWPISFNQTDDRLTTPDELKKLVNTAHNKNSNVILDFVAHHVHNTHPYYVKNPNWVTKLEHEDGIKCIGGTKGDKYNQHWDGECRLKTWFDLFLPTLDLMNPEVTNMLADTSVFWLSEYQFDGFRHDATKHIPEFFWRENTKKLKKNIVEKEKRRIYQIGETYGTAELISSYVGSGQLDAQFDFNVYDAITGTLIDENEKFSRLTNTLFASFKFYGFHHLMGNITGNQDRGRFASYAGGALSFNEDAKEAGWSREIKVGDPVAYKKSAMLMSIITTIPGIPIIYYGDEIGMPGGNDPDNRRMMKFDSYLPDQVKLRETTKKLFNFRKNNLALIYGDFKILYQTDKQLVYSRTYFDKFVITVLNKDNKDADIEFEIPDYLKTENLATLFETPITSAKNKVITTLKSNSFELIYN